MEADAASERVTEPAPEPMPKACQRPLSAWEQIDQEWADRNDAPMCM